MKTSYLLSFLTITFGQNCFAMDSSVDSVVQSSSSHLQNLIYAIRSLDLDQVRLIAAQIKANGQSLDQADSFGNTPLIWAVRCNDLDIVKFLTTKGASINLSNQFGNTPLMLGLMYKNEKIVNFLLARGDIDVKSVNKDLSTPLIESVTNSSSAIVQKLIKAGADVNCADKFANTPLHWSIYKNRSHVLKDLLRAGADVNLTNICGQSPFFLAFSKNNVPIVKELVEHGADIRIIVNKRDMATALHEAARFEEPGMIMSLMASPDFGIVVNQEDNYGNTPLILAASYGRTTTFRNLLSAGANVNKATPRGKTPLLAAVECRDPQMVDLCLTHGSEVDAVDQATGHSALMTAVSNGNVEIIKLLLSKNPNLGLQNRQGQTVMTIAANRAKVASRFAIGEGRDGVDDVESRAYSSRFIVELLKAASN